MKVRVNTLSFEKQMKNIVDYSMGFIDGAQKGKNLFLQNLGRETVVALSNYVDVSAKSDPQALHHIYEWNKTGSPSARLFDIDYTVSNLGLSLFGKFKQSTTLASGASTPFYNKAFIMENAIPVTIKPKKSGVLAFDINGETVFTASPVVVDTPGGQEVEGSFERTVDEFILRYFKQSFLRASGLYDYLNKPKVFKANVAVGSRTGRSKGVETGFKWITNAKIGVE